MNEIAQDCEKKKAPFDDDVVKIILFGSFAKNEQHFGSDVDVLFIMKENSSVGFDEVYEYLMENWSDIEWAPQFMTERKLQSKLDSNEFWVKSAISTGVTVFPLPSSLPSSQGY